MLGQFEYEVKHKEKALKTLQEKVDEMRTKLTALSKEVSKKQFELDTLTNITERKRKAKREKKQKDNAIKTDDKIEIEDGELYQDMELETEMPSSSSSSSPVTAPSIPVPSIPSISLSACQTVPKAQALE